ncbi:MAG: YcxB family protein [Bacteroidetes bacterium]|nr:YcxB family protein [Bacteroidota bacterium]
MLDRRTAPVSTALCEKENMEVTTNINRLDLIKFNMAVLPRMKSTYITILSIAVLIFAFILWKHGMPNSANKWFALMLACVGGGVIGMLAGVIISFIFILTTSNENNGILGEHNYKVTTEGLHERTKANEGLSKWEGIQEVKIIGSYLLLRISGYLFHVIPKRSFSSDELFNSFAEASVAHWQKSHNQANSADAKNLRG